MGLRIAFVAGLSDKKLLQKLLPLEQIKEIESIDLYRREKLESGKTKWIAISPMMLSNVFFAEFARFLKLLLNVWKYDVLIGCNQTYHGVMAYFAGLIWRKPVIQIITTDVDLVCGRPLLKRAVMSSAACAVRGEISKEKLKRLGYKGRVEILANVYPYRIEEKRIADNKNFDLVFVSHYTSEAKDFPWLLEILSSLKTQQPDFKIAIVGKGHEKKLEDSVKKYGLKGNITFTGELHGEDLDSIYKSSKILLLTSKVEGLPMAIVEAMSLGLPMVVTDVGDIPWLVRDGIEGYLVKNGDTENIVKRILSLINNPESLAEFRERSKMRYHELSSNFQEDNIKDVWERLINSAINFR